MQHITVIINQHEEELIVEELIGEGIFGDVHKATNLSGNHFALKIFKQYKEIDKQPAYDIAKHEYNIQKGLNHPNVVKCLSYSDTFKNN